MSDMIDPSLFIKKPSSYPAVDILVSELKDFEKSLTKNEEVFIFCNNSGMRLFEFRARGDFVILKGVAESGSNCRLVCNTHQLAISFWAVPKPAGQEEPRRIGFFDKSDD